MNIFLTINGGGGYYFSLRRVIPTLSDSYYYKRV